MVLAGGIDWSPTDAYGRRRRWLRHGLCLRDALAIHLVLLPGLPPCHASSFFNARGAPPPLALARRLRAALGPQALWDCPDPIRTAIVTRAGQIVCFVSHTLGQILGVMTFGPGDPVHVAALGKGIVREARNGGRYLVEIKGHAIDVAGTELTASESARPPRRAKPSHAGTEGPGVVEPTTGSPSLDLHGRSVAECLDALSTFLNTALLDGHVEVRIIHGRSGGRLKAAVHARLKRMPSIRGFGLDPRNPGVTIVRL
jgi:hypothetical protein